MGMTTQSSAFGLLIGLIGRNSTTSVAQQHQGDLLASIVVIPPEICDGLANK